MMPRRYRNLPVHTICVKVPAPLYGRILDYIYNNRIPLSDFIRTAIIEYLKTRGVDLSGKSKAIPEPKPMEYTYEIPGEKQDIQEDSENVPVSPTDLLSSEKELLEREKDIPPVPKHGTEGYINRFKAIISNWSTDVLKEYLNMPTSDEERQAIVEELKRRGEKVE